MIVEFTPKFEFQSRSDVTRMAKCEISPRVIQKVSAKYNRFTIDLLSNDL